MADRGRPQLLNAQPSREPPLLIRCIRLMNHPPDPILAAITELIGPVAPPSQPLPTHFTGRTLRKGEYWLREGEPCRKLGFIHSGSLRLYVSTDGETQTRWAFFAGQFFTSLQAFQQRTVSTDNIVAMETTEIYEIDREQWWRLHETHPFLQQYWQTNMDRLATCFEDRVNSLLLPSAKARYLYTLERYPDFVLRLPHKYVAEMLNMAPRHLSRVRRELAEK